MTQHSRSGSRADGQGAVAGGRGSSWVRGGGVPHAAVQLELGETRDLDAELREVTGLAVDVRANHLALGDRQPRHEGLGLGGKDHGAVDPLAVGGLYIATEERGREREVGGEGEGDE